jgi:phage-related protein (TIGR01555 family)
MSETKTRRVRRGRVSNTGQVLWTDDAMEKLGGLGSMVADGWTNVLTGLGLSSRDKRVGMDFRGGPRLSHQREFLEELYHGDDIVGRIVDLIPQEMYREWIDLVVGTEDGVDMDTAAAILQELDSLGAQSAFADAESYARLYGGSVILLGVDDGNDPSDPLDFNSIRSVEWMAAHDRFDVEVESFYGDPMQDKFGLPETYRLTGTADASSNQGSPGIIAPFNTIVHESRVIRFDGVRTSRRKRRENRGWGDSILERYYDVVRDFQGASHGIMHLLTDFSQAVFKIKGLAKALASDKDGLVLKRLRMLDISRSMVRAVPLDADAEEFKREGAAVAGLADLYDRMMMRLSAATGIPVTLLFGRSPAGMNATGESDIRLFYDHIKSMQETKARPRLEYLIEIMLSARDGPTGGVEPESWNFEWNPLYQESAKEQSETRLNVAKADEIYLRNGVVEPDEVAESRFGGDTYSQETMLDDDGREERSEDDVRAEAATGPLERMDVVPNYRVQTDEERSDQVCAGCAFADRGQCVRYGFSYTVGAAVTCDDWLDAADLDEGVVPLGGLNRNDVHHSMRARRRKGKLMRMRKRGSGRRGRNH